MNESNPINFITCDELRKAFSECPEDINKRILIIDVRHASLYKRSHLCLDARHNLSSIRSKMRVMNIDPDTVPVPTVKKIMSILSEDDLNVFRKRKDATEVVVIDRNTDNRSELASPKSKAMRIISALTRYDNQTDEKIVVPIQILRGGYREWLLKYPHFTTDSTLDPEAESLGFRTSPMKYIENGSSKMPTTPDNKNCQANSYISPSNAVTPVKPNLLEPMSHPPLSPKPAISKPVPTPPGRTPPAPSLKPSSMSNAPGTAVPVTPILSLRSTLPRSQSSPNVAQTEGDELLNQFYKVMISDDASSKPDTNNQIPPSAPVAVTKPRFDRTLKPSFNNEAVNAIRAQLNFGRSPEASGKAITGLQNLGNTCFMNSVIQCLAYAPSLVSYFCSDLYYSHINFNSQDGTNGELAVEFGALVEKLNAYRHRYIEPKSFRESIVKHIGFAGNEQQDSHEFMMMLFDKLHHDLNIHGKGKFKQNGIVPQQCNNDDSNINIPRATLGYQFWKKHLEMNKSVISDLFEGIFMSTLTCTFCKGQSNTFEVFNCLSLPIPSDTRCHVDQCLSHFSNPERIEAAWECPRCKQKREADKKIVICKLPKVLIIHLKRFSLDGRWRQKLQTTVDFPLNDLSVDCTYVLPQSAYGSTPSKYHLYAVVNHYGHLDGGHYTAFCKLENQRWYTFDDSNVSEMKDTDVCGQAAYILFYAAGC